MGMPTRATGETSWEKETTVKPWRMGRTLKHRDEGWLVGCKMSVKTTGRKIGCSKWAENSMWLNYRLRGINKCVQCMISLNREAEGYDTSAQCVITVQCLTLERACIPRRAKAGWASVPWVLFVAEILCRQCLSLAQSPRALFENTAPGAVCSRKLSKLGNGSREIQLFLKPRLSAPSASRAAGAPGGGWKGLPVHGLSRLSSSEALCEKDKIVGSKEKEGNDRAEKRSVYWCESVYVDICVPVDICVCIHICIYVIYLYHWSIHVSVSSCPYLFI